MSNSKNKTLVFIIVILLLANIAMLAYFLWPKESVWRRHGGFGMNDFLQKEVGFNDQQLAAFDSLKKQQRSSIRPLFEEVGKSKDSFYQLLGQKNVSDSVLKAAAGTIGEKQQAVELQLFNNFKSIRNLCTDAQRAKFDSLFPSFVHKMMVPMKRMGPPKKDKD